MTESVSAVVLSDIQSEIRRIVRSAAPATHELADEASLFEDGAVDSLEFVTILGEIERRFEISLTADDLAMTDLSCIRSLASYVAQRRDVGGNA